MKDLKYLMGYVLPVTAVLSLMLQSYWSFLTPVVAFGILPLFELLFPQDASNLSPEEARSKEKNPLFDLFLYFNLPLIFTIVAYYLWLIAYGNLSLLEYTGITLSVGIALGSNGINVAHELGHRKTAIERTMGKLLLLPSLYMHFYVDHNFGHHQTVGTPEDPSSAKYNQTVYAFWFQAVIGEYFNAWKIQKNLLQKSGRHFFSLYNDMFWYAVLQCTYLLYVYVVFGINALYMALVISLISILLLQTINYIEHYGLRRKKLPSGRYQRASEIHSWNSNHILGRMMLYELTRHSDHHHRAHKKYQLLEYHGTSPQMPFGYPTSMVISLVPPLWFAIMNPRIPSEMKP